MNSEERREARYQRRKAKREEWKKMRNEGHNLQIVSEFGALRRSFYQARKGTNWKASVQNYGCNVLRNSYNYSRKMRNHQKIGKGFIEFDLCERGKKRHISSVHITERVVQKSVCDYGIVPVIEKSLIYENGASIKGKGTGFSEKLLVKHLQKHYRKSGFKNSGYIVLGDEHNFFGSLDHGVVLRNMRKMITDNELIDQTMEFINAFDSGLGLGSQVCQINAVAYSNAIDHYIKEVLRYEYNKYMDDWYVIVDTKEEADKILEIITKMYADLGVSMNENKTRKEKISHGFTWLQTRYYLTDTGKVIRKPSHKKISRDRRKLKKIAALDRSREEKYKAAVSVFAAFNGYMKGKNAYWAKKDMEKLFNDLFIKDFYIGGQNYEQISVTEQRQCNH